MGKKFNSNYRNCNHKFNSKSKTIYEFYAKTNFYSSETAKDGTIETCEHCKMKRMKLNGNWRFIEMLHLGKKLFDIASQLNGVKKINKQTLLQNDTIIHLDVYLNDRDMIATTPRLVERMEQSGADKVL